VPSDRVRLIVTDVHLAVPASVGVEAGMVVLTEEQPPGRMLRIIIGQPEARAIMAAWQHAVPGRPSTWDLLLSAIDILGGQVDAVVITAVEEQRHYYAVIELSQDGDLRTLSCRPSDAIALAVRAYNSAILAEEAVLEAAGVLADGSRPAPEPVQTGPDVAGVLADGSRPAPRPDPADPVSAADLTDLAAADEVAQTGGPVAANAPSRLASLEPVPAVDVDVDESSSSGAEPQSGTP
jgi:uncharacterized protein